MKKANVCGNIQFIRAHNKDRPHEPSLKTDGKFNSRSPIYSFR